MHDIIVEQGFAVVVTFYYNICFFKNPVIMILKVVGSEDCVREQVTTIRARGEAPSCWTILAIFFGKKQPC